VRRVLVGLAALVVLVGLFLGGVALLDWTESTEFCTLCHRTMEPEAVTHQVTAHANVDCGTCHIGEGIYWSVYYHLTNARYAITYPFGLYERPLETPRSTLRPAADVCGQCHQDGQFYPPRLVTRNQYAADEANTLTQVEYLMKTGNGQAELLGDGVGAHWHIVNPVTYIAGGEDGQDIPWVQVVVDGQVREYFASDANFTDQAIAAAQKDELDCMDCHSRAQHRIPPTAEAVDEAMAEGLLPADLPNMKAIAMEVLEARYDTREAGFSAMDAVADRYQSEFPDVFSSRQEDVERAVEGLRLIYSRTHFPTMNQYWDTYPDNVGHTFFPGCMRCHDGDHLTEDGQAIRAECNLCHSIPQEVTGEVAEDAAGTVAGAVFRTVASLPTQEQPESHRSTLWIAEHRYQFDLTCAECHTVGNPGGTDNSSFCSNSVCHGRDWPFLALDNERVQALTIPEREPATQENPVPHPVTDDMDCEFCHGLGKVLAFPEDHATFTRDLCFACHPAPEVEATPEPEVTPTEEVTETPEATPEPTEAVTATPEAEVTGTVTPEAEVTGTATPEAKVTGTVTPEATVTGTPEAEVTGTPEAEVTGTPEAEVTGTPEAEETAAPEGEAVALQPPAIPHELTGREACLACHAVDSPLEPAPENHAEFSEDQCQTCHTTAVGGPTEPVVPEDVTADLCLFCHGPYDALQARTMEYAVTERTTVLPHQYVPHDSTDPEDIPACDVCHDPHPLPVTDEVEFKDPGVRWCFAQCHHTGTFSPCSDCH
jgi:nitrate/TMAO reductase-like tetraheme cytochrome c subunit